MNKTKLKIHCYEKIVTEFESINFNVKHQIELQSCCAPRVVICALHQEAGLR